MFFNENANRRSFLGGLSAIFASILSPIRPARLLLGKNVPVVPTASGLTGFGSTGNVYDELGVTPVINGEGTMTVLGGSLMRPEVEAVMSLAGRHFVPILELEVAAGNRSIAQTSRWLYRACYFRSRGRHAIGPCRNSYR